MEYIYQARAYFAFLSKSMRCETPIAPQCQATVSDRQRSGAPARLRTKTQNRPALGIARELLSKNEDKTNWKYLVDLLNKSPVTTADILAFNTNTSNAKFLFGN